MGSRTVTCNGTSGGKYNLTINYWVNYQDTVANVSNIYVEALLQRNDGYAGSYYNLIEGQNSAYIDVGGSRKVSRNLKIDTRNSAVVTLASWSGNVSHNADGTLTLSVGAGFSTPVSSLTGGSVTDSWTLTTIPRKSDFSIFPSSVEAGKTITVTISPASSSFSHKVTYAFGANSSTASLSAGNKTSTKTIPMSWLAAIPDNTSGTASVTVETLSGGTSLGAITRYFTVVCPADVKPTISSVSVERIDNNVPANWGVYLKGESQAKVTIVGAQGAYGSTITSYQISGAGFSGTSSTLTTGILNTVGTYTFTVKVVDSRGQPHSLVSSPIEVKNYVQPEPVLQEMYRCDTDGTRNDNGNNLLIKATYTYTQVSGNAVDLKYRVTKVGSTPGEYVYLTPGIATVVKDVMSDYSYTLELKTQDLLLHGATISYDISTAATTMNFAAGGKGIAVGKVSEKDGLEVAWPTYFEGDVAIDGTLSIGGISLLDRYHPIGSIYLSMVPTDPTSLFGGTWAQIGAGRMLVGVNTADSDFNEAGKTGGSKALQQHTHTMGQAGSHYHELRAGGSDRQYLNLSTTGSGHDAYDITSWKLSKSASCNLFTSEVGSHTHTINAAGTGQSGNMPPYITCYMWQRTA